MIKITTCLYPEEGSTVSKGRQSHLDMGATGLISCAGWPPRKLRCGWVCHLTEGKG